MTQGYSENQYIPGMNSKLYKKKQLITRTEIKCHFDEQTTIMDMELSEIIDELCDNDNNW